MTRREDRRTADEMLDDLRRDVAELTEPYVKSVWVEKWTTSRNRKRERHTVTHQSLLDQVQWNAAEPARTSDDAGAVHTAMRSSPPGGFDALDVLLRIEAGSALWVSATFGLELRDSAADNIRAIFGVASGLERMRLKDVADVVHRWRTWCRVACGWQTGSRLVRGHTCPDCRRRNSLRASVWEDETLAGQHEMAAFCTACGQAWDGDSVGVLQAHLRREREAMETTSDGREATG